MIYFISVCLVSIIIIIVSVYSESLDGNITHMENGREPEAGVSLAPYIVVPIILSVVAYQAKKASKVFGANSWCIIYIIGGTYLFYLLLYLPGKIKRYKLLLEQRTDN